MRFSSTWLHLAGSVLLVFAAARCSGGSSQNPPKAPTSTVIGATGGTAASSDGALKVTFPSGALPANVTITLTPTTSPGGGALGTVYEIGPAGTTFAQPVTMTFSYAGVALGGQTASNLRVATYGASSWQTLAGYSLDSAAQTVSGTTTHLSMYALWAPSPGGSSSGGTCAPIEVGMSCGSSSGSSSGTLGGSSTGSGGGTTCTAPTCATGSSAACAGYPGATAESCADTSTGFTASCCFAEGAPVCFAATGGVACSGGGGSSSSGGSGSGSGGSGSGGTTTCTPDTCAASAATMCAQYPGASMTSCTDSPNGYQASCCYPSGKPVCVTTGEGAACSGSSGSSSSGAGSGSGSSSGSTSCGPAPTCASASPCAGVAGTTMQSCTDSADGYTATCCYPVGTLPQDPSLSSGGSSSGTLGSGTGGGSTSGSSSSSSGG